MILVILATITLSGSLYFEAAHIALALALLTVFCVIGAAIEYVRLAWEGRIDYYDSVYRAARTVMSLTPDEKEALGFIIPRLQAKIRARDIVVLFAGNATMEDLERFMHESDHRTTSPTRNWSDGAERARYKDILQFLLDHKLIRDESAAGNHSYLWIHDGYDYMMNRYIMPWMLKTQRIPDLSEQQQE
jgi:hypothetical protein